MSVRQSGDALPRDEQVDAALARLFSAEAPIVEAMMANALQEVQQRLQRPVRGVRIAYFTDEDDEDVSERLILQVETGLDWRAASELEHEFFRDFWFVRAWRYLDKVSVSLE